MAEQQGDEMRKPDVIKMKEMLSVSNEHRIELDKLSDEDVLYEFLKAYDAKDIPTISIDNEVDNGGNDNEVQ